jgi:hypothetical protein
MKLNIDVLLFTVPVNYPVQRFAEGRPIRCTTNLVTHSCVYTVGCYDSMYDLFSDYHKLRLLNMLTVGTNVAYDHSGYMRQARSRGGPCRTHVRWFLSDGVLSDGIGIY